MLTGKQKRFLRSLGHNLQAVITIGKGELSDALVAETGVALEAHELIKVKLLESCQMDRHGAAEGLAASCGAEVAQVLGRTFLLYRPSEKPKLALPKAGK